MFKKGDFIKIKPGTKLVSGDLKLVASTLNMIFLPKIQRKGLLLKYKKLNMTIILIDFSTIICKVLQNNKELLKITP